jgi:tetratricopeptide (TPR) repeat protein
MVVESILVATVFGLSGIDRTILIVGILTTIFMLILTVTLLAFRGPRVLTGKLPMAETNTEAYKELGDFYFYNKRDWDKALCYYKKIEKPNSKNAQILSNIGRSYYEKGNYAEDITYQNKATQIDSSLAYAWECLALGYSYLNKHKQAIEKRDYDLALEKYQKAFDINPNLQGLTDEMAQTYDKLGDQNKAKAFLEQPTTQKKSRAETIRIALITDVDMTITSDLIQREYAKKLGCIDEYEEIEVDWQRFPDADQFNQRLITLFSKHGFTKEKASAFAKEIPLQPWASELLNLKSPKYFVSSGPDYFVRDLASRFGIPHENVLCSEYSLMNKLS